MKELIEKQNKALVNTLITIATSSTKNSEIPISKRGGKTDTIRIYETLINNPYKYKQHELFKEVHYNQKKQPELKIWTYKLQRSDLCKLYGWGIHGDKDGRIALIPCESSEYRQLLANPIVSKKNAYKKAK